MNLDLAEARQRLRRTETQDKSAPLLAQVEGQLTEDYMFATNMDKWVPLIEPFSLTTRFVTFESWEEADALFAGNPADPRLHALEARVDAQLRSLPNFFERGAFAKLSSRSPKDVTMNHPRTVAIFEELAAGRELSDNDKLITLCKAELLALRVRSAADILGLFCASKRIKADLQLALDLRPARDGQHPLVIVLREWRELPLAGEFRGFVHEGRLTALSQYADRVFFAGLAANPEAVVARVRSLFDAVSPLLRGVFPSYVIDFVAMEDSDDVIVLELNPWAESTDGCQFSWVHDRKILRGEEAFEFRFVRQIDPNLATFVCDEWKHYFPKRR